MEMHSHYIVDVRSKAFSVGRRAVDSRKLWCEIKIIIVIYAFSFLDVFVNILHGCDLGEEHYMNSNGL